MALDLATVNAALFAQLKSVSAGSAVRAALGASAASVITAETMRKPLPVRPFVAFRAGNVGGESEEMRSVVGTWWIYDDPNQGYTRINTIISLIEAAYPLTAITYGTTHITQIGQGVEDTTLGMLARSVQLVYRRRA